jgi:glucose/arabinose dehydrogenase
MRPTLSRRNLLAVAAASATMGLAGCSGFGDGQDRQDATATTAESTSAAGPETTTDDVPDAVGLETLATGFEVPLDVAFAPEADRRYVADQAGRVFVHGTDGLRDEPFLDLQESIVTGYEAGLLGFELHPDFAENRRAFVRYSAPPRSGTPEEYDHTFVLAEFAATADGTRARRDSERSMLELPEPQGNHNAGSLAFGPDGYLYVGVGDGGGGGDQGSGHVDDWYDAVPGGNGQDVTENLLGSVLRIDVDGETSSRSRNGGGDSEARSASDRSSGQSPREETADGEEDGRNYAIPDDNPLVGEEGLDEHYAWGFRNPWGMSFDGDRLLVADVGQSDYEEVNLVEKGGNYGWNVKEGTHCFRADDCPDATPESVRGGEPLLDPVVEYSQDGGTVTGQSVIGGRVYRGTDLPGLEGAYLFGDLAANGRLFVATPAEGEGNAEDENEGEDGSGDEKEGEGENAGGQWPTQVVEVAGDDADAVEQVYSFGRDDDGEVYVLASGSEGGGIHRVVPAG